MGDELVECHSGYTYPDRPVAFTWQGRCYEIETVEAEWRSPEGKYFHVRTQGGLVFDLLYRELYDGWQIIPA